MEIFENLRQAIENVSEDVEKFYQKGNKAAGGRIRKAMQEVKKLAQDLRVNVQEIKNAEKED